MINKEYHVSEATITYLVDGEEREETGQLLIPSLMFLSETFILAKGKKQIAIHTKNIIKLELEMDDPTYWVKAADMRKDIFLREEHRAIEQRQMEENIKREKNNTNNGW